MTSSVVRLALLVVFACTGFSNAVSRTRRNPDIAFPFKLRIVTLENEPYVKFEQGSNGREYHGFLPDLLFEMSKRLHFEYEFYPSPDGRYGSKFENGSWNGLVGQVMAREYNEDGTAVVKPGVGADIAAAPLTMTSAREREVDFVKPFHHLGLTLVVQKAYMANNDTDQFPFDFSIFKPLSGSVWGLILLIAVAVSVLLSLLNHFNPYEYGCQYKRGLAKEYQSESFSVAGSFWFVFTTLQWQGFERSPRSIAGKILTFFWFAFVTITLVTYVGALVNHLWWASMVQRHNPAKHPVTDLADIVNNNFEDFKVGVIDGGSSVRYVRDIAAKKQEEFRLLKNYWDTKEGSKQLMTNTDEAIKKVRTEKFVFIMETMTARWHMNQRPCDLTTIGEQFALRSYALAVPKNSPFLEAFHKVIMELNEEAFIDDLETKWWEGKGECWNVTKSEKTMEQATAMYVRQGKPKNVTLTMYWGVIMIAVLGMIFSVLAAVAEILYYKYRGQHNERGNRSHIPALPKLENDDVI